MKGHAKDEKPKIIYTIHFGEQNSFMVNEWLYNYFNSVKNDTIKYVELYKILTGINKRVIKKP